jgi:hypothetical protein
MTCSIVGRDGPFYGMSDFAQVPRLWRPANVSWQQVHCAQHPGPEADRFAIVTDGAGREGGSSVVGTSRASNYAAVEETSAAELEIDDDIAVGTSAIPGICLLDFISLMPLAVSLPDKGRFTEGLSMWPFFGVRVDMLCAS